MSASKPITGRDAGHRETRGRFWLLVSITVSFLAGSSAPTPLYPLYQRSWGFAPITITVIFGIYALAVLAALLIAGRLSDYVGRRPVLVASTLLQLIAMIVFGTASGGLFGALMVHFLPAPLHLVYALFALIFVLQCVGVAFMRESLSRKPGALASLKPQFAVPPALRMRMSLAIPALTASWSLAGFYAALAPALIQSRFGLDPSLYGGMALCVLASSGAAAVLWMHRSEPLHMMRWGAVGLIGGVLLTLSALSLRSVELFFVGSSLAGMGFGAAFQGAIRMVVPLSEAHQRAGLLSVVFVVSYLAMGLPAIAAGVAIALWHDVYRAACGFGLLVSVLAAIALVGTFFAAALRSRPVIAPRAA